jgi:tRNA(adenine34) deaminase
MPTDHEHWMDLALSLARAAEPTGNTPVAAIIVRDGVEIGRGTNEATTKRDPILHAEIVAIQDACRRTGSGTLDGATLYSTMEPCPMCAWGIRCAGLKRVVLGARAADLRRTDMGSYAFDTFMVLTGQEVELVSGVRTAECVDLRSTWSARTGRVV